MAIHMRLFGPVACSGFARSTGPSIMVSCSSSSPDRQLLSPSRWADLVYGDFGGWYCRVVCLAFSGGALVFGAGGGGAFLVLLSAFASGIAMSSSSRCACSLSSCASCVLSRSSDFFSLEILRHLVSSFLVFRVLFAVLLPDCSPFVLRSAARLLILLKFSRSSAWGIFFLSGPCACFFSLSASSPRCFSSWQYWCRFFSSSYSRRASSCLAIRSCSCSFFFDFGDSARPRFPFPWCHRHLAVFVPSGPRGMLLIFALQWFWRTHLHHYPILLFWRPDILRWMVILAGLFLFPVGLVCCFRSTVLVFAHPCFLFFILVFPSATAWRVLGAAFPLRALAHRPHLSSLLLFLFLRLVHRGFSTPSSSSSGPFPYDVSKYVDCLASGVGR